MIPPAAPSVAHEPTCSVIVVTYNSATTLGACLRALQPQVADVGGELLVLDNGSTDVTATVAAAHEVRYVSTGANLGFGPACNLGARHTTGELIVLVNPDAVLDPGALRALLTAVAVDPRVGPLGGWAHHEDGSYDRRSVLGHPRLRGAVAFATGVNRLWRGSWVLDPEHGPSSLPSEEPLVPVRAVSGALLAVRRALWDQLDGFDERFFLYGEDVDLCVRAVGRGAVPVVVTGAGYRHVGGVSSAGSDRGAVLLYRGKVELYRRHLTAGRARLAVACLVIGTLLRSVPALVGVGRGRERGQVWWRLFRAREGWTSGHAGHRSPEVVA